MDHSEKDINTEMNPTEKLLNMPRPRQRIVTADFASPPEWRVKKMDGRFESKHLLARTPLSIKDSCSMEDEEEEIEKDPTETETKTVMDSTDKETKMEMDPTGKETKIKTDHTEKETKKEMDHTEKETKNDLSKETETRPTELVSLVSLLQSSVSSSEERLSSITETLLSVRALAEKQAQARNVRVRSLTELQQRMSGFRARLRMQKEQLC